ncbi:MAG: aminotransferase class IV [Bacteroidota bacterium]|nr:aminotransferase class IV [Bacteroidota bacterium]
MAAIRGEFVLINGFEQNSQSTTLEQSNNTVIYEVIRLTDGIPLFFEDHLERLINSFKIAGKTVLATAEVLENRIKTLAKKNHIDEGNVMIRFVFNQSATDQIIYFVPHSYPSETDYMHGVRVGLLYRERINPEAKVVNQPLRDEANRMIASQNLYEVLLVGKENNITEGSRSNVCFLKNKTLITAPPDKVLKGITWLKTLDICRQKGIAIEFRNYSPDKISGFDAAFITGTSPKLLPIASVENIKFDTQNALMHMLMHEYDELIASYVKRKKA